MKKNDSDCFELYGSELCVSPLLSWMLLVFPTHPIYPIISIHLIHISAFWSISI